jgi:hypothetical protein
MGGGVGENASTEHRRWNRSEVMKSENWGVDVDLKVEDRNIRCQRAARSSALQTHFTSGRP